MNIIEEIDYYSEVSRGQMELLDAVNRALSDNNGHHTFMQMKNLVEYGIEQFDIVLSEIIKHDNESAVDALEGFCAKYFGCYVDNFKGPGGYHDMSKAREFQLIAATRLIEIGTDYAHAALHHFIERSGQFPEMGQLLLLAYKEKGNVENINKIIVCSQDFNIQKAGLEALAAIGTPEAIQSFTNNYFLGLNFQMAAMEGLLNIKTQAMENDAGNDKTPEIFDVLQQSIFKVAKAVVEPKRLMDVFSLATKSSEEASVEARIEKAADPVRQILARAAQAVPEIEELDMAAIVDGAAKAAVFQYKYERLPSIL